MSNYKSLSAKEAAEIILGAVDPVVLVHIHPDADTVGTMAALCAVFRALGKSAAFASSDEIPKRLEFLIKDIPRVTNFEGRTVISVDVSSPKQGGAALASADKVALMIDHHEVGEQFADGYVVGGASSAGEVLLDIIDVLCDEGKLTLTKDIAEPLFAAISSDTGSFRFSSADANTFRAAARLIEAGIDHAAIAHKLFFSKSPEQIRAEGLISGKIRTFADGRLAMAAYTKAEREALGLKEEHFDTASDIVRSVAGVEVSVVLRETDDGGFKASLRSTGLDVAEFARGFGGGGHVRAAGCSPKADNIEEAAQILKCALLEIL